MDLTQAELSAALSDAGNFTFPRKVGSPGQSIVGNPTGFFRWWAKEHGAAGVGTDGKSHPMFIGHSGIVLHDRMTPAALKAEAKEFVFEAGFGDFDTGNSSGLKPHEVEEEVGKVSDFFVDNRLDHYWKASGSDGGFHAHPFFEREVVPFHYLNRWENAFWRGLMNELNLRSINIQCAEPKRMERIPYSRYVHNKDPTHPGEYVPEERFCVPVPWNLVHDRQFGKIRELTRYPEAFRTVRYEGGLPRPRLEQFVRRKGWEAFGHVTYALHPMATTEPPAPQPDGMDMRILMKELAPDRLCIQTLPFGSNPRHGVRVALLCEFTGLGMGYEEAIGYIMAVGKQARWKDLDEGATRRNSVSAFRNGGYSQESCFKLRTNGVCVGQSCRLFRESFPEEWRDYQRAHHPEVA